MLRLLSFLLLLALLSCQKETPQINTPSSPTETKELQLQDDQSSVHPSILASPWWKDQHPVKQTLLAVELSSTKHTVTLQELEERQQEAIHLASEKVAGASPGFPSANAAGDVVLGTQSDVDAFGAQGYKTITGALDIIDNGSADPICDLTPLDKLKEIGSSLTINSPCLSSLDGLNKLKSIGELGPFGFIGITGANITDIEALDKLKTITGSINVIQCDQLVSIQQAFSRVTSVKSGKTTATLTSVFVLNVNNNDVLTDISGFRNLTEIEGGLRILDNLAILNLDDLSGLASIGDDIFVVGNGALQDVNSLSVITSLNDDLFVFDNPSLTQCCGLYNLLCSNPPTCTSSGVGDLVVIFNNGAGCTEADIAAGGNCP